MKTQVVLLTLLIALTCQAQIDPDPDGIGVYLDMEATQYCGTSTYAMIHQAYICITRPSNPTGVQALAFGIIEEMSPGTINLGYYPPSIAIDLVEGPDHLVIFEEPQFGDVILVTTMQFISFDFDPDSWRIIPHSSDGRVTYVGGGPEILDLYPMTGSYDLPVLIMDGECDVVASEEFSWGEVKSLFH